MHVVAVRATQQIKESIMFTNDNTNGQYTDSEIDLMNQALEHMLSDCDPEDREYDQYVKAYSDRIQNNTIENFTLSDLLR
jgi:hypothetical protein